MDNKQNKDRTLVMIGPDGRALRMEGAYQDPRNWDTIETEDAVLMVARPGTTVRKLSLLDRITNYVDEHLAEKISLKSVAEHCGVSVSTVTQLFQRKAGTTFHSYLTQRRMAVAEQLVREGIPLEEVGRKVSYTDHSSFYRAFKQHYGVSPREYRRRILMEE